MSEERNWRCAWQSKSETRVARDGYFGNGSAVFTKAEAEQIARDANRGPCNLIHWAEQVIVR